MLLRCLKNHLIGQIQILKLTKVIYFKHDHKNSMDNKLNKNGTNCMIVLDVEGDVESKHLINHKMIFLLSRRICIKLYIIQYTIVYF